MQATRSLIALATTSVLALAGCGGGGGGGSSDSAANPAGGSGTSDTTAPTVVSLLATAPSGASVVIGATPAAGVTGTSTVNANFSEAVGGVNGTSMTVAALGANVAGNVAASVNQLTGTFTPSQPFACGVLHTVNLGAPIADTAGNPLATVTRQFSTKQIDTWTFVDGDGNNGLNRDATLVGSHPKTVVHNGKLYATWVETPTGGGAGIIRVAVMLGTDAAPTWRFVDGDVTAGLNRTDGRNATSPMLAVNAGRLYAIWLEDNAAPPAGIPHIRVASFNGNDGAPGWTYVDGNGGNGLNRQATRPAASPFLVSIANRLYAIWAESSTAAATPRQIRISRYNGDGLTSSWAFVDGGNLTNGINFAVGGDANNPFAIAFNDRLYVAWDEATSAGATPRIRVKVHTPNVGNEVTSPFVSWETTPVATGLNVNSAQAAREPSLAVLGNRLFLAWNETAVGSLVRQVRVRMYSGTDATPIWNFVDGGGATGINHNVALPAADPAALAAPQPPRIGLANGQIYATWVESTGGAGATGQVRMKVYDGSGSTAASWISVDGNAASGLNKNAGTFRTASHPVLANVGSKLYAMWSEANGTGSNQIRAKVAGCTIPTP